MCSFNTFRALCLSLGSPFDSLVTPENHDYCLEPPSALLRSRTPSTGAPGVLRLATYDRRSTNVDHRRTSASRARHNERWREHHVREP